VSTSLPLVVIAPNIATPCGLKFFVVDVDVKKERGDLTLEELERKHGTPGEQRIPHGLGSVSR
jgi:Bifunctional DNA primase/polymerase, N-terminal